MVQKTFETNFEHGAWPVLLTPSCVHLWLAIAECLMFKGKHAKTFLQDDFFSGAWKPVPAVSCMEWHTVPAKRTGETCTGEETEISPQGWETHVLFLEETLIFFLVLCICQVELELQRGMDGHAYGYTAVLQPPSQRGKDGNKTELLKSFCCFIPEQIYGCLPFPEWEEWKKK